MRIAFLAQPFEWMYAPKRGGSLALWIYYMAKLCVERGHESVVVANQGGLLSARSADNEGVPYIFTPTFLDRLLNKTLNLTRQTLARSARASSKIPLFGSPWHHRGYAVEAALRARRLNCDVVHVMNYSQFVPVIRKIHPRCKIGLHMQCEWLTQLDSAVVRQRLEQTDLIIGCSQHITRTITEKFPEFADRCVTVPNGAHVVPDGQESSDNKVVVFVGRLSPEKGLHDLIEAFHLVLRRFPDARLQLVGPAGSAPMEFMVSVSDDPLITGLRKFYRSQETGSKDSYLEILEAQAGPELGKRITFEGSVSHKELDGYYERASILVNPSLIESFGISLIEAMMRRVPVVATRVGGMKYTVDEGVTGLLVEPGSPQRLADALCEILADRDRARRMGEAGRKKAVENFSWARTADLLMANYSKLLGPWAGTPAQPLPQWTEAQKTGA